MSADILDVLECALRAKRFAFASEHDLQYAIAATLDERAIDYSREVRLATSDRIDFLVDRVGIEVKIKWSLSALTRQLFRYAQSDRVDALLIVTPRMRLAALPPTILSKPIRVVCLAGGSL